MLCLAAEGGDGKLQAGFNLADTYIIVNYLNKNGFQISAENSVFSH